MARALIVGCGCHGRELGGELAQLGWRVRGTSRDPERFDPIESAGLEPALADPDSPGTVLDLCGDVSAVIWLLGSASGTAEGIAAIHGPRLERLLEKLVDTPVRGFVYEAAGPVEPADLRRGAEIVERAGELWRIPLVLLTGERSSGGWARRSAAGIADLLS